MGQGLCLSWHHHQSYHWDLPLASLWPWCFPLGCFSVSFLFTAEDLGQRDLVALVKSPIMSTGERRDSNPGLTPKGLMISTNVYSAPSLILLSQWPPPRNPVSIWRVRPPLPALFPGHWESYDQGSGGGWERLPLRQAWASRDPSGAFRLNEHPKASAAERSWEDIIHGCLQVRVKKSLVTFLRREDTSLEGKLGKSRAC